MASTEKFIDLVRKRPILYELCNTDYKNRIKRNEAWLEIALEMGTEKDGKHWMAKWKALKDNYAKHKKSFAVSAGPAYKKYKNWPWAKLMRFLDDFSENKPTEGNIKCELLSQPVITLYTNRSTPEDVVLNTHENFNRLHKESQVLIAESRRSEKRKRKIEALQPTDKALDDQHTKDEQESKFNEVDYFFLSYAQSFKKLPKRMQSMIKLEIATMFARYELQNEEGESGSSSFQITSPTVSRKIMNFHSQNPLPSPSSVSFTESGKQYSDDSNSS